MNEPIQVSQRFRRIVEATVRELLTNAASDERLIPQLENADHRRRQTLLVRKQLERAFRLMELLGAARTDSDRAA